MKKIVTIFAILLVVSFSAMAEEQPAQSKAVTNLQKVLNGWQSFSENLVGKQCILLKNSITDASWQVGFKRRTAQYLIDNRAEMPEGLWSKFVMEIIVPLHQIKGMKTFERAKAAGRRILPKSPFQSADEVENEIILSSIDNLPDNFGGCTMGVGKALFRQWREANVLERIVKPLVEFLYEKASADDEEALEIYSVWAGIIFPPEL